MASAAYSKLQHRVWRWHFFAGLMVIPFAVILAISGGIYLFKAQFNEAFDARVAATSSAKRSDSPLSYDALVQIARSNSPEGQFKKLHLPTHPEDTTVELEFRESDGDRTYWVDIRTGEILHDSASEWRFMKTMSRLHGSLLSGNWGGHVVETMSCWMIILIITGAYLWWPRTVAWWRVFLPDFSQRAPKRALWKQLHGTAGAWIGGMILILLLSGLPWSQVWGEGFKRAQELMSLHRPGQEWFVTLQSSAPHEDHAMHDAHEDHDDGLNLWETGENTEGEVTLQSGPAQSGAMPLSLDIIVAQSVNERFAPPIEIQPPRGENGVWTVRSMTQHRPDRETVHYDQWTGGEVMRIKFEDHNPLAQFASYGIALHEGALFGWFNQLLGVIAALGVIFLSITGAVMWWKRKPVGSLGVPPMPSDRKLASGVCALIIGLCLFLPLAGLTLIAALTVDTLWSRLRN